jgi:hypothetical protein
MNCRVCGNEIFGLEGYKKTARVCSKNCWQDLYNEPDIDKPEKEEGSERNNGQDNDEVEGDE